MRDENTSMVGEFSLLFLFFFPSPPAPSFLYKAKARHLGLIFSILFCFGVIQWYSTPDVHLGALEKINSRAPHAKVV